MKKIDEKIVRKLHLRPDNPRIGLIHFISAIIYVFTFNQILYTTVNRLFFLNLSSRFYESFLCLILFYIFVIFSNNFLKGAFLYSCTYSLFLFITSTKAFYFNEFLQISDFNLIPELYLTSSRIHVQSALLVVIVFLAFLLWFIKFKKNIKNLFLVACSLVIINSIGKHHIDDLYLFLNIPDWTSRQPTESLGPLTYFWLHGLKFETTINRPSRDQVEKSVEYLRATVTPPELKASGNKPKSYPNVYLILVESFWDPHEVLNTTKSVDPFHVNFRNLHASQGAKFALVPQKVGGTAFSEIEILCGLPAYDMKILIKYNLNQDLDCLPNILKRLHYKTYAAHQGYRTMWNRNLSYPKMGFESYLSERKLSDSVSSTYEGELDRTFLRNFLDFIKLKNSENDRNFYYGLTFGLHTPFILKDKSTKNLWTHLEDKDLQHYFSLLKSTTEELYAFFSALSKIDPEGIIIIFGDHLPHSLNSLLLQTDAAELLARGKLAAAFEMQTPLVTRNIDLPNTKLIRIPFLTSLIYRTLGLPTFSSVSDYYQNPDLGFGNYNLIMKDEKLASCQKSTDSIECEAFLKYKEAFRTISEDAFFGNQYLRSNFD